MKQKLSASYSFRFSPDHRPRTERSTSNGISLGLSTLLESNLGCFQRVPPSGAIVLKAFSLVVLFFRHSPKFCDVARRSSFAILLFCTELYDKKPKGFLRFPALWECFNYWVFHRKRLEDILKTLRFLASSIATILDALFWLLIILVKGWHGIGVK